MSERRSRSPDRRSRSPDRRSRSPLLRSPSPLYENKFGFGLEMEFNTITWYAETKIPKWVKKKFKNFVDGGAIYKKDKLQITTEKSQQGDGFDIEAQMGVFNTFSLEDFNTSCEDLKVLLGDQKDKKGKAQLTLSFHISKYPSIFLFYYKGEPFYKKLYDVLKEKTKDLGDTVFGFILYTSYYFVKLQTYRTPSLHLQLLQEQSKNITIKIDELVKTQRESRTLERQKNISLLGQQRFTLSTQIKDFEKRINDQSIFKAYFPLKPRTNIHELFLELSKDEQTKIKEFNFNILTGFDESIIWDMTPMKLFDSLRETPANKIAGMELPLNEIFEFCKRKKKQDLWDQSLEVSGETFYSANFVNVGPDGFIAIEFRDFKKVTKLAGYMGDYKDGLTIDEFQDRVGVIVDNFLTPFFIVKKSAFKYRKSLKKIPKKSKSKKSKSKKSKSKKSKSKKSKSKKSKSKKSKSKKSKSKKSKTKERNKTCNRGSKSGQKTKR